MTGQIHSRRTPRGFLYGAAGAALAFVLLGALVGRAVRAEEERAFDTVAAWAGSTMDELVRTTTLAVVHHGEALAAGRPSDPPPFVGRTTIETAGGEVRSLPPGMDLPVTWSAPSTGLLISTEGGYRLQIVADDGALTAEVDLGGMLGEVERLSVGMVGVTMIDRESGVRQSEPVGPGEFSRRLPRDLLGRPMDLVVVAGPNAAMSGRDAILATFLGMGLICGALVLAVGRSTAGRLSESEHRAAALEEISAGKDRFIASVSHELRTPLAAIQGFSMELTETIFDPVEHLEIARVIAEQSQEMGLLVEDLLVAGRVDAGTIVVDAAPMSLVDAVAAGVAVISVPDGKHVGLSIEPVWAVGDPLRVRQVVRNLLTNALRYGGRSIDVVVRTDAESAILEVVDDGPGIDVEDPSVVFQPYYRLSDTRTMPASVGLGLTVARDLAELMGGSLTYQRVGGKTVFRLRLRLAPPAAGAAPVMPADAVA